MHQRIKYIIIICLASFSIYAQESYQIDTLHPVHDLEAHIMVLPDTGQHYTLEQIRTDSNLVFNPLQSFPAVLDIHTVYWGKLSVTTDTPIEDWELHFEDRLVRPVAWVSGNGKVDVYAFQAEELLWHQRTGADYAKRDKYDKDRWFWNRVGFEIPANQNLDIYIRIEGNSFGIYPYFNVTLRAPGFQDYAPKYEYVSFFHIFLFGVTFIIFLYHFLQWIYLKEPVFFWFSLWIGLCAITEAMAIGLDTEFILGYFPELRYPLWLIIPNSMLFTFWFFGRSFIQSKQHYPKLDKFMLALPIVMIIELVGTLIYLFFFDPVIHLTQIGWHYYFVGLSAVLGFILAIVLTIQEDPLVRYFGIGAMLATGCILLGGLWSMQYITLSSDPYTWGIFLQTIAYAFGIAFRQQRLNKIANEEKLLVEKTKNEIARVKDLEEIKSKFFANISHEFRTPLSLISGPLKRARKEADKSGAKDKNIVLNSKAFNIVTSNVTRLQSLVDQLLELSKLESGVMMLNLSKGGIISYISSIINAFESLSERQNISLNSSLPKEITGAYYDKDKLEKIISNLLSNAFKYNRSGGAVTISVHDDHQYLHIEVTDTGKGISSEDLQRIFQRFYRAETSEIKGSGIGLALTKELIELHNGHIRVQSTLGQGTTFKIKLPITLAMLPDQVSFQQSTSVPMASKGIEVPNASVEPSFSEHLGTNKEMPLLLLVEDNTDLRDFISELLSPHYEVLTANNGDQGARMAIEHIPDIVISDVMMPKKDGYQLCHDLKSNTKTSHIPIILLTAKAAHENKLEGLTLGADAYVTKPFDDEELLIRVKNLIESKQKMWEHFNALDNVMVKNLSIQSMDDQFLQDVFKTIKNELDNEHLSVNDIARAVGFSRSQLHRKLKALTNKSANQLIVEMRLNEARLMLQNKAGSVSEIAYSVGYANMSYFTKSFKEKFGVLPSKI